MNIQIFVSGGVEVSRNGGFRCFFKHVMSYLTLSVSTGQYPSSKVASTIKVATSKV